MKESCGVKDSNVGDTKVVGELVLVFKVLGLGKNEFKELGLIATEGDCDPKFVPEADFENRSGVVDQQKERVGESELQKDSDVLEVELAVLSTERDFGGLKLIGGDDDGL